MNFLVDEGADVAHRVIRAPDYHSLSVPYFAPAVTRLQRAVALASTLACQPANDQPKQMILYSETCAG